MDRYELIYNVIIEEYSWEIKNATFTCEFEQFEDKDWRILKIVYTSTRSYNPNTYSIMIKTMPGLDLYQVSTVYGSDWWREEWFKEVHLLNLLKETLRPDTSRYSVKTFVKDFGHK